MGNYLRFYFKNLFKFFSQLPVIISSELNLTLYGAFASVAMLIFLGHFLFIGLALEPIMKKPHIYQLVALALFTLNLVISSSYFLIAFLGQETWREFEFDWLPLTTEKDHILVKTFFLFSKSLTMLRVIDIDNSTYYFKYAFLETGEIMHGFSNVFTHISLKTGLIHEFEFFDSTKVTDLSYIADPNSLDELFQGLFLPFTFFVAKINHYYGDRYPEIILKFFIYSFETGRKYIKAF